MVVDAQASLFGEGRMAPPVEKSLPESKDVRDRLGRMLETLRASETMPFTDRELRMWRTVVPNMAGWLPKDEGDAVCTEFARHMERLGAGA